LQKGIYAQQTTGDLDGAIRIYRQIIASNPAQGIYGAQAQMHLAQALLQKGDLTGAAQEFTTLSANYSEFHDMIASMAGHMAGVEHGRLFTLGTATPPEGEPYQYKHYLTGVELNAPAGWKIEGDTDSSGGGEMVTFSSSNLKSDTLAVWLKPSAGGNSADIARQLRASLDRKGQDRDGFEGWKVRLESVKMQTLAGHQALSAIADYSETSGRVLLLAPPADSAGLVAVPVGGGTAATTVQSRHIAVDGGNILTTLPAVVTTFPNASDKMVEYMIWVRSPKTQAFFFGRANAIDLAALESGLDQLAATAVIP